MKRKLVYIPVIIIITGLIIAFSLIINNSVILTRIYYKINYKGNVQNFESIIEKSELFEYQKYCKYRDSSGEVHNVGDVDYLYRIDREFIESLKLQIEDDKKRFHFYPSYSRSFVYSVEVTNESLIYLTYNNNSIIKAEYANHTEIFAARSVHYNNNPLYWVGNWYLNFTHITFAPNSSSTIVLNDIFLVKMNLKYHYKYGFGGGEYLIIEQFLCFNSNFQTTLVYFPLTYLAVE
ncbi:hypothetical protein ES705_36735 [subsurface metagenome]